ncbi:MULTISPECIES: bacteriochlorophyll 4-vinyl reductase [unclassified Roseivivax]|uniref:bacteriochlorophyll 4-vinyl reductase n=1 Tax=Roseivivax sp. GX 12232 TaxID=2900547 RepID=UPI001E573518|nr:bacteriochlorophyll 4-vinyl reductase [Roseivivax sp. GX 12232]MCE0506098.1 bacteriochlorophyll 4-vinyl reductase [Roseivivax sp. GX 12232]
MGANMVAPLHAVLERHVSKADRDAVFAEAGLEDLPAEDSLLPEGQVAFLHRRVRENWPEAADEVLDTAGRVAAEVFVTERIPPKARLLLQNMPWSVSAWLVGKSIRLNSETFAGSGLFAIQTTSRFAMFQNPLATGIEAERPICQFYAALFEHTLQRLSHRDFICRETHCQATGHGHCVFEVTL